ncbi:MAG: MFS transporter [Eggerthellaceae bacterium]|nr:MFS transporter [Eggerthellaceae bacterium]
MEATNEKLNPFQAAPDAKKKAVLIALFLGVFGSILHTSTLSTLLPVAAAEIGGLDYYSLANTLSGVISIAAMPLFGYLCARNASLKRPLFAISLIVGAVVVFARAFAADMMTIVIPASLYGLVSAGVFVVGYGMIRDLYDPQKAGMYLGFVGTMQGIAMLLGPVAAGAIMDFAGWRMVCHIIWPFLLASGLLVWFGGVKLTKEESAALSRSGGKFDLSGTLALCVMLAALMLALSLGTSFIPFGSPVSLALFAATIIALVVMVIVVRKKKEDAVIPTPALKDRNTISLAVSNFFTMFSNMAIFFFIPMYLLQVLGTTAAAAGLATSCLSIAPLFICPVFGKMIGKARNARFVLSVGLVVRIAVCLGCLVAVMLQAPVYVFYVLMVIGGVYGAAQSVGYSVGPQVQIPENIRMQGNSVVQVGQNFGSSVGVAIYTVFIGMFGVGQGMFISFGVAAAAAAVALVFTLRLKPLGQ